MDNKKPSPTSQNARRKSGGSTQLRSPVVKRPSTAPVALQGWLHKQGSDGLMLWKKRWFVLSEYCLFYYKGPEEEKLLGSILLPSYKVSQCTADDKVYRKYAFKAEHANMRTYYFAAETHELMIQWTNALNLATILQDGTKVQGQDHPHVTSLTSAGKQNSENFGYNSSSGPITIQPTSQERNFKEGSGNENGWVSQNPLGPYQPLYANAPPKPKRLNNEGQYVGSSPEASPSKKDDSDNVLYGSRKRFQENITSIRPQDYHYHSYKPGISPGSVPSSDNVRPTPHLAERTPEHSGWHNMSAQGYGQMPQRQEERNSNYLDVFQSSNYSRGMSPRPEGSGSSNYGSSANYQHPNQYYQSYQPTPQKPSNDYHVDLDDGRNGQSRRNRQPPRPHSADFLDYDAKKMYPSRKPTEMMVSQTSNVKSDQYNSAGPPRPKSSLDIMHSSDGYYWSEENYAEKMRQSAMYLQNSLPQRSQSSRGNTPILRQLNESGSPSVDFRNAGKEQISTVARQRKTGGEIYRDVTNSPFRQNLRRWSEHQDRADNSFIRSASARLPKQRGGPDDDNEEVQAYTGGEDFNEGKKEESMKRLLEWKQRMLQSPLTRKSSGSSTRGVAQNELSKQYKQQVLKELEKQEAKSREEFGKRRSKTEVIRMQNRISDGRRSAILSSDRYYSYSSDDEENDRSNEERTRRMSQSRKSRRGEDSKGRKAMAAAALAANTAKMVNFASPNYENVTQSQESEGRFSCFSPDSVYEFENDENFPGTEEKDETPSKNPNISKGDNSSKSDPSQMNPLQCPDKIGGILKKGGGDLSETENFLPSGHSVSSISGSSNHKIHSSKKSNWNEKIDETKLIKEFSYQYIKDPKIYENNSPVDSRIGAPTESIVKNRIKQLKLDEAETDGNDGVIKEPLKVSSPNYYLHEAVISNLKSADPNEKREARKKEIGKFALGGEQNPSHDASPEVSEKHQKSVKDLLADFERKSQLAQEREEHEKSLDDVPGKRCVFSDTETLLYDTSSDTEEKKKKPDPSILNSLRKSECRRTAEEATEEEDKDEEVAAALSRRDRFFNSCRETSRKRDSDYLNRGKRIPRPSNLTTGNSSSSDIETVMTPGYPRSTLTESVAPLENSDSTCSTPTIDRIKDNLVKTLPKENLTKSVSDEATKEEENCEGHYMPMTPSRRVSAPSSDKSRSNSSLHSFLFGADAEETYVEMAENTVPTILLEPNKSSLSKIRKSLSEQDAPRYYEVTGGNSSPHYDFLYRASMLKEPEYMEVNTLLEILKEQDEKLKEQKGTVGTKPGTKSNQDFVPPTPPRSTLPDILNSSTSQQATKSDSSDADDESSKDLDSLDIPRHPRFSLSDTFRPASYYLGTAINDRDRNIMRLTNPNENPDSSDSDLVSPPPIPTSPPPLDDTDVSLETERSLEIRPQNFSKFKLGDKDGGKKLWNASANNQAGENVKDTEKKKRRPVSEDVLSTLEEAEQFFTEKPLMFSELDSIGSRNGLALDDDINDINLDQYLEELQLNGEVNPQLYAKNISENLYKSREKEINKNLMTKQSGNKTNSSEKGLLKAAFANELAKENEEPSHERSKSMDEIQYENLQTLFPPPPPELYESSNDQSDRESSLAIYRNVAFPEVPPPDNYCDAYEPDEKSRVCFDPDTLKHQMAGAESTAVKNGASFENQGAPYYYSDIIKNEDADFGSSNSDKSSSGARTHPLGSRYQPLNNQRDNVQEVNLCSKRNDIGRKVNPISQNYLPVGSNQSNELDDVQKITAELRTTSAHFMGAADKSGTVDVRNIYESDTLQRRKGATGQVDEVRTRTPDMHHPVGVARNLYPQGLRDKSSGPNHFSNLSNKKFVAGAQNRTRSLSIEGSLNDPSQFRESENAETSTGRTSYNPFNSNNSSVIHACEADDYWDKDVLWRESLRKVSLRQSRSLDNLDDDLTWNAGQWSNPTERNENSDKFPSGRRSVDHFSVRCPNGCPTGRRSADHFTNPSRNKLRRNVTYVNDAVRRNKSLDLTGDYEEEEEEDDYREEKMVSRKRDPQIVVDFSDSGVLDCDDGVHYEKLIRNPAAAKQSGRVGNSPGCSREMPKKSQPVGKEQASPNENKVSSASENGGGTPVNRSPGHSLSDGLPLETLDREKLRQWDMMSSGMVEQGIEQKKLDSQQGSGKDVMVKKSDEAPTSVADSGEYVMVEQRPVETVVPTSEASGSGSVMRESHLPISATPQSESPATVRQSQKATYQVGPTSPEMTKENQTGRPAADFVDRHDYFDRGKIYSSGPNGYSERKDSCGERREDFEGGDDLIKNSSEKGRSMTEGNYYADQYQDRKIGGRGRNYSGYMGGGKSYGGVPLSSVNIHGSPLGRPLETPEGRYSGKENSIKRKVSSNPWGLDVSAGELLGRTHEELVLLLIQLRRQSASVCKAMESCHIEIEEQARLAELDTPKRLEHIRKLEKLKKHLLELEKQYEKGKPLVNLVDNMVKLGSLYKGNHSAYNGTLGLDNSPNVREKLEFNQKVQEQRLLAEERRDWDRVSSDHGQLQAKVQQLYKLDKLLQEESGTLHILQQDKELLEKALGGLRHKLQVNRSNPVEADRYRKQQKLIEKELSRVRLLLAHNSKKLEETVAENARLEQELVILRQKLQASRVNSRSSVPLLPESATLSTTAALEAELRRVQQLVGDLQRQRHELSAQVKQLTEKSDTLVQQIRPGPTGVAGAGPIPGKKKSSATWLETDLDLLVTQNVGVESQVANAQHQQLQPIFMENSRSTTPIYINTEAHKKDVGSGNVDDSKFRNKIGMPPSDPDEILSKTYCTPVELSEADERMKRFYGIIPREKQEIKTVRIVKRESERRQRDRDRSGNIGIPIGNVAVAKRVSVIEENENYYLGRVEEESYENVSNPSTLNEFGEDQKVGDFRTAGENRESHLNFHPTNPFLPQNLPSVHPDEVSMIDFDQTNKRSFSLPRGFGKSNVFMQGPSRYEANAALRNVSTKRNRVRFENHNQDGSGSESGPNSPQYENSNKNYGVSFSNSPGDYSPGLKIHPKGSDYPQNYGSNEKYGLHERVRGQREDPDEIGEESMRKEKGFEMAKPLTAREQLFGSNYSFNEESSPQLSPVYQSEAAREIIMEVSNNPVRRTANRRQIRKEKRRHHTVSNIRHVTDSENHFSKMGSTRSRDDLDMERALRPRINAPDVVRSTMNHKDLKYNENTIDNILGTPNKILIPERYIPEQEPTLTAEEQMQRSRKAESIRKMLSETTAISTPDLSGEGTEEEKKSCALRRKVEEEKKQREHLLELNQILAQQVMEKSKLVAVKAMSEISLYEKEGSFDDGDLSPVQPLPIYQQRENFYS